MSHQHYTHLSYEERVLIAFWNKDTSKDKKSLREFAESIGRHPSTISRELRRNGQPPTTTKTRVNKPREDARRFKNSEEGERIKQRKRAYEARRVSFLCQSRTHYTAKTAQRMTFLRIKRVGLRLEQPEYEETLQFVLTTLDSRWSPEQISGRIKLEGELPYISHKSIYNFIDTHEHELSLKHCLRRKGKKYRKQKQTTYNTTDQRKSIDERSVEVDKLARIGDLEGDTIVGKDKADRLLTHVERKSGLLSIGLVHGFDADKISNQTTLDLSRVFGIGRVQTITYDNGSEFTRWRSTEWKLGTKIYFAHPYRSCERGRNENANGLIRDFLPKGTDFKDLTTNDILTIESLLNNRPRERLGWLTPSEYYALYVHSANVALEG